jgi:segregation and condensation protein B
MNSSGKRGKGGSKRGASEAPTGAALNGETPHIDASVEADATEPALEGATAGGVEAADESTARHDDLGSSAAVRASEHAGDVIEGVEERQPRISEVAPASQLSTEGELGRARIKQALESLVFVSDRVVTAVQLARAVKVRTAQVRELLAELIEDYQGRGLELFEVAGGYQFRSAPACAPFVREFVAQKPIRLTRAQLETLALIGYRQPITRPEIDDVRGVDSGSAMRVLLERGLIKMLGRKDEPGRPLLYGTTAHFLEFFGMRSLKDLPTLREFTELSDENRALFKRKTGEAVEDAEAALAAAEEAARLEDEAATHISDEDLAALAAEADVAEEQIANGDSAASGEEHALAGQGQVDPE